MNQLLNNTDVVAPYIDLDQFQTVGSVDGISLSAVKAMEQAQGAGAVKSVRNYDSEPKILETTMRIIEDMGDESEIVVQIDLFTELYTCPSCGGFDPSTLESLGDQGLIAVYRSALEKRGIRLNVSYNIPQGNTDWTYQQPVGE